MIAAHSGHKPLKEAQADQQTLSPLSWGHGTSSGHRSIVVLKSSLEDLRRKDGSMTFEAALLTFSSTAGPHLTRSVGLRLIKRPLRTTTVEDEDRFRVGVAELPSSDRSYTQSGTPAGHTQPPRLRNHVESVHRSVKSCKKNKAEPELPHLGPVQFCQGKGHHRASNRRKKKVTCAVVRSSSLSRLGHLILRGPSVLSRGAGCASKGVSLFSGDTAKSDSWGLRVTYCARNPFR